ncbi:hypothetical protein VKT23_012544 [Stygiomarasmius scandens]|uniref:Terpene synthase n=1 Tax=Marasmiellus scandens TaxID=2682957 RepID=A0ABR1JAE2_9AGAR
MTVREEADIVMDALRDPKKPRPVGEWIGGEVARQFWLNAVRTASPTSQRRFINTFQSYLDAVVQQAEDRTSGHIRDVESYFEVRRDTIGAKPSFAINEIHMNIPDEVIAHPTIVNLSILAIDMLIIGNDLCSYNVEQSRGDHGHNLVTVVINQFQLDVQKALNWIGNLHDGLANQFLEAWKEIPTYGGPIDREIRTYADGLGNWVRGNDSWSFESDRYFGKEGLEIEKTRKVKLLPKLLYH